MLITAKDASAYIQSIPITVNRGEDAVTTGFTTTYFRVNRTTLAETAVLATDAEIVSISNTELTLDLRMIEKETYRIKIAVNGVTVAQTQFTVSRDNPAPDIGYSNKTSIAPKDVMRYDAVIVNCNGNSVEYPERILKMIWMTNTNAKKNVRHNEGRTTLFNLSDAGLGFDSANDWVEVYIDYDFHPAFERAIDSSGNTMIDEKGNSLIFN